ncbi:MAG: DUF58 domain-containing protein [Coriobacteriia bacterium]|nr:DUF58 domain-containing protein [Coriobacteriia bacterium]
MRLPAPIARAIAFQVTPRAALLLLAPVPFVVLLRGWAATGAGVGWLLACGAALAYDATRAARPADLEWSRELPVKLSIGVPNTVTLTVHNRSARTARIVCRDTPPPGFEGSRVFGPLTVGPRGEDEVTLRYTPPSRGRYLFGGVGVRSLGPWGLAGWQAVAPIEQEAKVYPDIQAVRSYALLARKGALAEMGVKRMRYAGQGTEFESLREYEAGDDYRDIDWKATARRGRPIVRSFEAERSQTIVLAIDAGRLMTARVSGLSKLDRAVNAALLLAYLGTERDDLVGLLVFGRDVVRYLPPKKGHRQFLAILEALYSVESRVEEPDYGRAMRYLASKLSKRSLVVLFTDLVGSEPSRRLLASLTGLMPRHLPLLVTQRNRDVEARSRAEAATESDVFAASVAETLLADKSSALRMLAARGALVLDVHPEELSVATVNRYLEVKARGRL